MSTCGFRKVGPAQCGVSGIRRRYWPRSALGGGRWAALLLGAALFLGSAAASPGESAWVIQDSPSTASLHAIRMVSQEEGWAVGRAGTILHRVDGRWSSERSPTDEMLFGVDAVSADDVWAVGNHGVILRRRDGMWSAVESPTSARLSAVDMVDGQYGWAVGVGVVLRYRGTAWLLDPEAPGGTFVDIHMVDRDHGLAVAVTRDGSVVLRYTGGIWESVLDARDRSSRTSPRSSRAPSGRLARRRSCHLWEC